MLDILVSFPLFFVALFVVGCENVIAVTRSDILSWL